MGTTRANPHWLFSVFVLLSCVRTQPGAPAEPTEGVAATRNEATTPISTEPPEEEASVRPGVNAAYFREDGLARYTPILEGERREVVEQREAIIGAMGLTAGMTVADIGAGTGLFTVAIAPRVEPGGTVYAVDIVPAFLERIRDRVSEEKLQNVEVVMGAERATNLEPGSIDLAFMCDTYHHLEYPLTYMRSLFEALRTDASLVLIDLERIEGQSSKATLAHVRAGKDTVIEEVVSVGFVLDYEADLLEENYYLRFRRP